MDPIACSRTPKWRCRPSGVSRRNEPALFTSVFVDGARSASPPTRCGRRGETAASTAPLASRVACGGSGGNRGRSWSHPGVSFRASPSSHWDASSGKARRQASSRARQSASARAPSGDRLAEAGDGGLGQVEHRLGRPAEGLLRTPELRVPQGLAVRLVRPRLLRRAVSDHGPHGDQGRAPRLRPRRADGRVDRVEVVAVGHDLGVPAEAVVSPRDVLREREGRLPGERDQVVVVEDDQLAETEVAGQ